MVGLKIQFIIKELKRKNFFGWDSSFFQMGFLIAMKNNIFFVEGMVTFEFSERPVMICFTSQLISSYPRMECIGA